MIDNFQECLKQVLKHEGGYVDHPEDPGGATMKGVTLQTYRWLTGEKKTKADLKLIPDYEVEWIYRAAYWDRCRCYELPAGVDLAVFDAAVNSGTKRAAEWLQWVVGAKQDGVVGPKTVSKAKGSDPIKTIDDICFRRISFLRGLKTWRVFGCGWNRRINDVKLTAYTMAESGYAFTEIDTARRGSVGPMVRNIQAIIGVKIDGVFGPKTEAALMEWQRENGLAADGIAGPKTYQAMGFCHD